MKKSTFSLLLCSMVCLSVWGGSFDAMNTVAVAAPSSEQAAVAKPVKLTFSPAEITREIRKANVPASALPLTPEKAIRYLMGADRLLKTQPVSGGHILLYSKQGDRENFYAAYLAKDTLYDLGETGTLTSLEKTDVRMDKLTDAPLLRIRGFFGANVVETTYFYLMGTEPRPLLVVEGPFKEQDIDADGLNELVATSGTPPITTLYKYIDGRYQQANLNRQLGAASVLQDPKEPALFEVTYEGQTKPVTFRYVKGTMQPVTR